MVKSDMTSAAQLLREAQKLVVYTKGEVHDPDPERAKANIPRQRESAAEIKARWEEARKKAGCP